MVPENDILPAIFSGFCDSVKMFELVVALKAKGERVVVGSSALLERTKTRNRRSGRLARHQEGDDCDVFVRKRW